ncbi:MAG: hypothetical protein ACTSVK_03015 [Promethearchaeota archaeon]
MGSRGKSYGCLLFFVIVFFLTAGFSWFVSLSAIYGEPDSAINTIGDALGDFIGRLILGAMGMAIALVLSIIFLILLIVYIVKKNKK